MVDIFEGKFGLGEWSKAVYGDCVEYVKIVENENAADIKGIVFNNTDNLVKITVSGSQQLIENLKNLLHHASFSSFYQDKNYIMIDFKTSEKIRIINFFNILNNLYHLPDDLKSDIYNYLGIKTIINEEKFYLFLEGLIQTNQFEEATKTVKAMDCNDNVLFKYAELLNNNGHPDKALDIYQKISLDNPNHRQAQHRAEEILLSQATYVVLNPDEKKENMVSRIRCLLRAGNPKEQNLLDRHVSELIYPQDKGELISVSQIAIDEDTIIKLILELSKTKQEVVELNKTVAQLTQQLSNDEKEDKQYSPGMFR